MYDETGTWCFFSIKRAVSGGRSIFRSASPFVVLSLAPSGPGSGRPEAPGRLHVGQSAALPGRGVRCFVATLAAGWPSRRPSERGEAVNGGDIGEGRMG